MVEGQEEVQHINLSEFNTHRVHCIIEFIFPIKKVPILEYMHTT